MQLGDVGRGAGDPATLDVLPDGSLMVALAGTDELLLSLRGSSEERRFPVGRRPVATLALPGSTIAVADSLGSSVSFVDVERG